MRICADYDLTGQGEIFDDRIVADRFSTPLMLYKQGELQLSSDELYDALAPIGRFLPPDVMLNLGLADEEMDRILALMLARLYSDTRRDVPDGLLDASPPKRDGSEP